MEKYKFEVLPYNPKWKDTFRLLAHNLRSDLDTLALRIDHIGSTSVKGMAAKPIIDIQISVESFDLLDKFKLPLNRLGYIYRQDNQDLTKRYFREKPGTKRTHIHVRRFGSYSEQEALLFRDYLRKNPQDAFDYATLKSTLATQFKDLPKIYVEKKGPFIWELLCKARLWSQKTGWTPGPSDF